MILAAGRGERLKPLTDSIPKALCIVKNKPLIVHHVENLASCGFHQVIINHAYLGGKIRQYLGNGLAFGIEIIYSSEPPGGLETGGGIVQALPILGTEPFVTVNADIYTDYNFNTLVIPNNRLAHLVLVKKNPTLDHFGDFGLNPAGDVNTNTLDYTFAGIAYYQPKFFQNYAIGRYSVTPLLRKHLLLKQVSGEIYAGQWFDIGSLQRLEEAKQSSIF
jgi:MurNAc alpha-1-phosphate uridylyltransferase